MREDVLLLGTEVPEDLLSRCQSLLAHPISSNLCTPKYEHGLTRPGKNILLDLARSLALGVVAGRWISGPI